MQSLRAISERFITSSAFIALCAVALALETSFVATTPFERPGFYAFIFLATWSSYRVHAFVARPTRLHAGTTALLITATFLSAFSLHAAMIPWLALAALLSLAYSLPTLPGGRKLREYGVAKILILTGVWTLVTGYLPVMGKLPSETIALLLARRFLFMFALCIAFDLRDRVADERAGIRTVPVRVGDRASYGLVRITLLAFAGLILLAPLAGPHQPGGWMIGALLLSALVTWFAIEHSRRRVKSNLYYLGWIDGMMAVQGLLVVAAKWMSSAR